MLRERHTTIAKGNFQSCQNEHPDGLAGTGRTGIEIIVRLWKKSLEKALKHIGSGLKGYNCIREDVKGNRFGLMKEENVRQGGFPGGCCGKW